VVPAPIEAAQDKSDAYDVQANGHDCWANAPRFRARKCSFGDADATRNVVLVGNSHAGQWLPTLQGIAATEGFRITTLLASRCAYAELRQQFDTHALSSACLGWVQQTTRRIVALHPDLVVLSNRISVGAEGHAVEDSQELYADGYAAVLGTLRSAGVRTLVVRDTPAPGSPQIPDCVAQNKDAYQNCDGTRGGWLPPAPEEAAVQATHSPLVTLVDLTDHICGPTVCHAVTGGVITYFDGSHLTATYAATLAPYLEPPLRRALGR
jgi:hypothetical protein